MSRTDTSTNRLHNSLSNRADRQRIRTCPGCDGAPYRRFYTHHVRNDCGDMISVPLLREQLNRQANKTGFPLISYDDVAWIIEHLAATRNGIHDLGDAGMDADGSSDNETIDLTDIVKTVDAIAAQSHGEPSAVERDVSAITTMVADMDI